MSSTVKDDEVDSYKLNVLRWRFTEANRIQDMTILIRDLILTKESKRGRVKLNELINENKK